MTAGRTVVGTSLDWCTPPKYISAVKTVFGGAIDLDPCSNTWSIVRAKTEWRLPDVDGLKREWDYETIYVNPPYGSDMARRTRIKDWLKKCAEANSRYGAEVIALVPVAANTSHWKEYVWPKAECVCFLYDTRLRFLVNGRDDGKGAPMACAVIYWGKDKHRFSSEFSQHGAVVDLSTAVLPNAHIQQRLLLVR